MELKQLFDMQRTFDQKMKWNAYEKCRTPEDVLNFMEHFVLVMVEELGEISRISKKCRRDEQSFAIKDLKYELIDVFVYLMQACMALNMDLEKEYMEKLKYNEKRFMRKTAE